MKGGRHQVKYAQIDGRVNVPLSMAVRMNERPPNDPVALKRYVPPANRGDVRVYSQQLLVRNAPGSNDSDPNDGYANDAYDDPTFRVRAELRKADTTKDAPGFTDTLKDMFICGQSVVDFPACLVLPTDPALRYLDVQMNADPFSNGLSTTGEAARTVDIVGGPFGGSNNIEVRGFKDVRAPGQKGDPARVTPAAALRFTNFNLGLKLEADFVAVAATLTYEILGDLVIGLAGHAVNRVRVSHDKLQVQLRSEGGADPHDYARGMTDMEAVRRAAFKLRVLWKTITLFDARCRAVAAADPVHRLLDLRPVRRSARRVHHARLRARDDQDQPAHPRRLRRRARGARDAAGQGRLRLGLHDEHEQADQRGQQCRSVEPEPGAELHRRLSIECRSRIECPRTPRRSPTRRWTSPAGLHGAGRRRQAVRRPQVRRGDDQRAARRRRAGRDR